MNASTTTRALIRLIRNCVLGAALFVGVAASTLQAQLYGNGSDGNHTVAGTEHLAADKNYINLTVPGGTILETHGFAVRVSGTLISFGTIRDNVSGGTGGTGGFSGNGGTTGPGQTGLNGNPGL